MFASTHARLAGENRYNVLFIAVDDLRPVLGCYGNTIVKTPHLDQLAQQGIVFENAYCQASSCLPSRTSLLTGLRVDTTRITDNQDGHFRERFPDLITLPQHFKRDGYFCREFGKVFHVQDPVSWSVEKFLPKSDYAYPIYGKAETQALQKSLANLDKPEDWWGYQAGRNSRWIRALSWEDPDVPDEYLFDGQLADGVIDTLKKHGDQPFFLGVGFFRPHLPFVAPRRYFDLYPIETLTLPENRNLPQGAPPFAVHDSSELRTYTDVGKEEVLTEKKQLQLLRAYYACVSYVDAQIGRVLQALKEQNLRSNTVIVLWSDHGYHFGEHGTWNKATNFEEATRVTLIVSHPGQKNHGKHSDSLVELIDLYPTLSEICGLPVPDGLEGISFKPLLANPDRPWKSAAFSQIEVKGVPGFTMRSDRYRYTEWIRDGEVVTTELYDHQRDPGENFDIAESAENLAVLQALKSQFDAGWKAAVPKE
ncbi:MAG: sulfatase [Verrucomicrobiae bacterium]|nr:sulfatase [Verrucomicrobiae bacterium]